MGFSGAAKQSRNVNTIEVNSMAAKAMAAAIMSAMAICPTTNESRPVTKVSTAATSKNSVTHPTPNMKKAPILRVQATMLKNMALNAGRLCQCTNAGAKNHRGTPG